MSGGKFIVLDSNLKPAEFKENEQKKQSELLEMWIKEKKRKDEETEKMNERMKAFQMQRDGKKVKVDDQPQKLSEAGKRFALGSKEDVYHGQDKGFSSTVFSCYNNHWVLKTCPEDWWISISQKIARAIDKDANHEKVRTFFVSHEDKKTLSVDCTEFGSIYNVDYEWFFDAMKNQISKNINNPEYTDIMDCGFSGSTSVQKIVNNIMLMYGFKEYFDYRMSFLCGIPGVVMDGSENDWKLLLQKHQKLEKFLEPIDDVLKLSDWFKSSRRVLEKLLDTYQGNPDTDWWGKIIFRQTTYGSGGRDDYGGWFISDFLGLGGLISTCLKDIPSGINTVPLTINDNGHETKADLVAGVTGYKVTKDAVTVPGTKTSYPVVQTVHGWGLFL